MSHVQQTQLPLVNLLVITLDSTAKDPLASLVNLITKPVPQDVPNKDSTLLLTLVKDAQLVLLLVVLKPYTLLVQLDSI